jgi:putative PIN family toxin of toxin-antitoxin system
MKVVFDSNVIISRAIKAAGIPARLFRYWQDGVFELLISEEILAECRRVMAYPHTMKRHRYTKEQIDELIEALREFATVVQPDEVLDAVSADASDNRILECAVAGEADYVITGDKHLLSLQNYRGILILAPATFLLLLSQE